MTIPKNIKREHVLKAIEEIDRQGVPANRRSKKYELEIHGRYYPPKYVLSLANRHANGVELDHSIFSGGKQTNEFLAGLGFTIYGRDNEKTLSPKHPKQKKGHCGSMPSKVPPHDERCKKCKAVVKAMLEKLYGEVIQNHPFGIGPHVEDFKDSPHSQGLKHVYEALKGFRGFDGFVKAKQIPRCDFFVPKPGFIVEFDETQHFLLGRQILSDTRPGKRAGEIF